MAKTKYNHRQLVESYQPSPNKALYPGMIVEFRYKAKNIFDKQPMILVLWNDYREDKIHGINLNYLTEFKTQRLLMEKNFKDIPRYSLYKNSYRTYKRGKMGIIKLVEYDLDTKEL